MSARLAARAAAVLATAAAMVSPAAPARAEEPRAAPIAAPRPDLSGRVRSGIASFYAERFAGRTMADGTPMDPNGSNAASRTLPLGTVARVTNVATGQSAIVRIRDRGPYVAGRIVDLSPATAREIGLTPRQGLTKVEVAPIVVPVPGGGAVLGDGARSDGARVASER